MSPTTLLTDFLKPGTLAEDVPGLHALLAARSLLDAFIALFRGGDEEVLVRLAVLREIGGRAEAPQWSPRELEARFIWLEPTKLDTVLKRLREHDLLVWDIDTRLYSLAPAGRMALAALDQMLRFAGDQDAELGFILAQVAGGDEVAVGTPWPRTQAPSTTRWRNVSSNGRPGIASTAGRRRSRNPDAGASRLAAEGYL
jgi:hypothetical protein